MRLMAYGSILFRCPATESKAQGWVDDKEEATRGHVFVAIECAPCTRIHFVNPSTGMILGHDEPAG